MKYNNRLYPHPVLGIGDDLTGTFSVDLVYSSDKDNISLSIVFRLSEPEIDALIANGKAYFLIQIYCRSTMYREIFKVSSKLPDPLKIPSIKLRGEVEIDFFVCAHSQIDSYKSKSFNSDYDGAAFLIEKSDILAFGGTGKFIANKSPEELKSVSSLIRIGSSGEKTGLMYNEYDGEKITIYLCEEDYENYQLIVRSSNWGNVIHSSIVLPALIDALYIIDDDENRDLENRRWYKALKEIKEKSKSKNNFIIAQNILELPVERCFETILRELE